MRAEHEQRHQQLLSAVERELEQLRKYRQGRFRAEDTRVKRLQERVSNMSLVIEEEEEEEEEEEGEGEINFVLNKDQQMRVQK